MDEFYKLIWKVSCLEWLMVSLVSHRQWQHTFPMRDSRTLRELAGRTNDAGNTGSGAVRRMYPFTPLSALPQSETPNMEEMSGLWPRWLSLCMLIGHDLIVHYFKANVPVSREFIFSNIMTNKEKWGNLWNSNGTLPLRSCFSETWANVCQGQALCLRQVVRPLSEFPGRHIRAWESRSANPGSHTE